MVHYCPVLLGDVLRRIMSLPKRLIVNLSDIGGQFIDIAGALSMQQRVPFFLPGVLE